MENNTRKVERKIKIRNPYVRQGVMLFLVGVALIIAFFGITRIDAVSLGIKKVNHILLPFYLGIVMAFLLCPVYNWVMKVCYKGFKGKFKKPKNDVKMARVISSVVAVIVIAVVIVGVIMLIVPGTVDSVVQLIPKIQPAFDAAVDWVEKAFSNTPEIASMMQGSLDDLSGTLIKFAQNKFLNESTDLVGSVFSTLASTLTTLIDILVALIICVYLLNGKELICARVKKLVLAIFKPERAESIFEFGRLTNNTFGGFINGKIIDSIIIGILCAILMAILGMPLISLISVIIGITNIIPFFGPFIGAIPSVLLLLIVDPRAAFEFAILILCLQQFDGNILGPKILGKATKISALGVMFAIIVGGGFFGFIGMILGVPVYALIYTYVTRAVNKKLGEKEFELDTLKYADYTKYGINKEEVFVKKETTD